MFSLPRMAVVMSPMKSSDVTPMSAKTRMVLGIISFRASSSSFLENLEES